jgi:hypothetical protein
LSEPVLPPDSVRRHTQPRSKNNIVATMLDARANQLTAQTLLSSQGAMGRTARGGMLRNASRLLRWWPRSWVGRVLGLGWCIAVFRDGYSGDIWSDPETPYKPPITKDE